MLTVYAKANTVQFTWLTPKYAKANTVQFTWLTHKLQQYNRPRHFLLAIVILGNQMASLLNSLTFEILSTAQNEPFFETGRVKVFAPEQVEHLCCNPSDNYRHNNICSKQTHVLYMYMYWTKTCNIQRLFPQGNNFMTFRTTGQHYNELVGTAIFFIA